MKEFPENINPDLLIAFLNNETNANDTALVKNWIDFSVENRKQFENLQKIWIETESILPQPAIVNTDEAWKKVSTRIDQTNLSATPKQEETENIFTKNWILKIAAVIIPLVFIGYLLFLQFNKTKQIEIVSNNTIIEKTLPDGTLIKLNKNSTIQFPEKFQPNKREVTLVGEAFFSVVSNPKQPFIIHSNQIDIKVVSTSFNVKSYPDKQVSEVFVKTGTVIQYAKNAKGLVKDSIILTAGNIGIYDKISEKLTKIDTTNENYLFWLNKNLVFKNTRLAEVFATIEEIFQTKIVVKDSSILNLRLTSSFKSQTVDEIMKVIAVSFNLKISKSDKTFEIDVVKE